MSPNFLKFSSPLTPNFAPDLLPHAILNSEYIETITIGGGALATIERSGSIPPGMYVNIYGPGVAVHGTPSVPGTYTFTVKAINNYGSTSRTFTLVVDKLQGGILMAETESEWNLPVQVPFDVVEEGSPYHFTLLEPEIRTNPYNQQIEYCYVHEMTQEFRWQDSRTFNGMPPNSTFQISARFKETEYVAASRPIGTLPSSWTYTVTTMPEPKSVTVGDQSGTLQQNVSATGDYITFPITVTGIANGSYPVALSSDFAFGDVTSTATINIYGTSELRLIKGANPIFPGTYNVTATIDGAASNTFTVQ